MTPSFGFCSALIVSSAGGASASLLLALATSLKNPTFRSSWVIVCVPVHVIDLPGASSATGIDGVHLNPSSAGVSLDRHVVQRDVGAFVGGHDRVGDHLTERFELRAG